jgi:hypothetical protein
VNYGGSLDYSWLVPHCLALSILEVSACPTCGFCWWEPEGVRVYSSTGLSVHVTNGDSAASKDSFSKSRDPNDHGRGAAV